MAREEADEKKLIGTDLSPAWKKLLENTESAGAVQRLVEALHIKQLSVRVFDLGAEGVQGVQNTGPTDYFRRILAEQLAPGDLRDQEVLEDLERWKKDRTGPMFERLFNATDEAIRYVGVWRYFAWRIEDADVFELVDRLISETLLADGVRANIYGRPALLASWHRLDDRRYRPEASTWLRSQIERALPISLSGQFETRPDGRITFVAGLLVRRGLDCESEGAKNPAIADRILRGPSATVPA